LMEQFRKMGGVLRIEKEEKEKVKENLHTN
jgi:hypothetical protein